MVKLEDEDGAVRRVPRCVARYETMRAAADSYLQQEGSAVKEIATAIVNCEANPNQTSCLDSGRALVAKAAEMHEALSQNAESAMERLAGDTSSH